MNNKCVKAFDLSNEDVFKITLDTREEDWEIIKDEITELLPFEKEIILNDTTKDDA